MTISPAGSTAFATTLREQVAADVRAELARRRVSGSALARMLDVPPGYVSRRLTGEVALDVDDLERIARALGSDVAVFVGGGPSRPLETRLPRLDSNQKPAVLRRLRAARDLVVTAA